MALSQHASIQVRFAQQYENAKTYLLPFINTESPISEDTRILEIGAGEGGVLKPFWEAGASILGVDLSESRIANANELMKESVASGKATFLVKNVYDEDFVAQYANSFDIILLKDTIEHIPDQKKFLAHISQLLTKHGKLFLGFPPWRMPFGGHQQIATNKWLSKLPYYHLLPRKIYEGILRKGGESDRVVQELLEIKDTGISIQQLERYLKKNDYRILKRELFLFNPIYKYKFGLKPRRQIPVLRSIPILRDWFTTAAWYVVSHKNEG